MKKLLNSKINSIETTGQLALWSLFTVSIFTACRKDNINLENCKEPVTIICGGTFHTFSTADFDYVKKHLASPFPGGPTAHFDVPYVYNFPSYNPNNDNEFAYYRAKGEDQGLDSRELWKFNGCTGEATFLTDQYYYRTDWGSNDWILFTGTGHQIYKIKSSGDSLTQLTNQGGFNIAGKWNLSATRYYLRSDLNIYKPNGEIEFQLTTSPFGPIGWLDDSTLIGTRNAKLYSLSISNEQLTLLNNNWIPTTGAQFIDLDQKKCYAEISNGIGLTDYFCSYELGEDGNRDTICTLYDSYNFTIGDYQNGKLLTGLTRRDWEDSLNDVQNIRYNILIMDTDATNQRLISIPE